MNILFTLIIHYINVCINMYSYANFKNLKIVYQMLFQIFYKTH